MAPFLGLKGTPLLTFITFTMGLGWVCFGLLGGLLASPWFISEFHFNNNDEGTVVGIFELGSFVGAVTISVCGNSLSRRGGVLIGGTLVCVGAAIQASTFGAAQLYVGRIVAGMGIGAMTATIPAMQAETAPAHIRGRLIACSLSMVLVGQLVGYWVDYGMLQHTGSVVFRFPCALQAVFAGLMIFLNIWNPESPRGRHEEAREVIAALRNRPMEHADVETALQDIIDAVALEQSNQVNWSDFCKWEDDSVGSRRRVLLACGIQFMQPFAGSTVISYYTTTIFHDSVGLTLSTSTLMSGFLQLWFLFASFLTWYIIERLGRRTMFLSMSFCLMTIYFICGALVKIDTHDAGIGAAVCLFLAQAFFTWGWMAGVWCYSAEIIPLPWRSKGLGVAVAMQWIWNFILLKITPVAVASMGYGFFFLFAGFSALWIPVVYFFYPETAGLSLELLDQAFMGQVERNPINEAARLRALLKEPPRREGDERGPEKADVEHLEKVPV